MIAIKREELD